MVMPPPDWLDATTVCPKRVQLEFHGLVCDIVMTDSLRAGSKVLAHARRRTVEGTHELDGRPLTLVPAL
jgi:hypothetical protein